MSQNYFKLIQIKLSTQYQMLIKISYKINYITYKLKIRTHLLIKITDFNFNYLYNSIITWI